MSGRAISLLQFDEPANAVCPSLNGSRNARDQNVVAVCDPSYVAFEILRLLVQRRDAMPRLTLFCVLVLATACGSDIAPSPTPLPSPSPTPVRKVTVFALVVAAENYGPCIAGATVEVTAGQSVGKKMTLTDVCDIWGDANGGEAQFSDLIPDAPMTLRASATGYLAQEMTVAPPSPGGARVVFLLSR
jgi:hypothetical protein